MFSKLILLKDNKVIADYVIDQEILTIGRRPENDLIINDAGVSGRHARILCLGADTFIEDLQSTTGTLINNRRIGKQLLQNDDAILIGQQQIRFQHASSAAAEERDKDGKPYAIGMEGVNAFSEPVRKPASDETRAIKDMASNSLARLQLLSGENQGRTLPLIKAVSRLGKPGDQVAAIARRPGGYFIMHLGGNTRPPKLNDEPLSTRATLLRDGDIIELGRLRMKFLLG